MFVVELSPKSQKRFVIVPVERLVKATVSGLRPLVGVLVKAAVGTIAPVPITGLVLLPAAAVVKTTALLKLEALLGLKRTRTLVEAKPGRLKDVPDGRLNGPPVTEAVPLLRGAAPRFVTMKLASALEPTITLPKLRLCGETAI